MATFEALYQYAEKHYPELSTEQRTEHLQWIWVEYIIKKITTHFVDIGNGHVIKKCSNDDVEFVSLFFLEISFRKRYSEKEKYITSADEKITKNNVDVHKCIVYKKTFSKLYQHAESRPYKFKWECQRSPGGWEEGTARRYDPEACKAKGWEEGTARRHDPEADQARGWEESTARRPDRIHIKIGLSSSTFENIYNAVSEIVLPDEMSKIKAVHAMDEEWNVVTAVYGCQRNDFKGAEIYSRVTDDVPLAYSTTDSYADLMISVLKNATSLMSSAKNPRHGRKISAAYPDASLEQLLTERIGGFSEIKLDYDTLLDPKRIEKIPRYKIELWNPYVESTRKRSNMYRTLLDILVRKMLLISRYPEYHQNECKIQSSVGRFLQNMATDKTEVTTLLASKKTPIPRKLKRFNRYICENLAQLMSRKSNDLVVINNFEMVHAIEPYGCEMVAGDPPMSIGLYFKTVENLPSRLFDIWTATRFYYSTPEHCSRRKNTLTYQWFQGGFPERENVMISILRNYERELIKLRQQLKNFPRKYHKRCSDMLCHLKNADVHWIIKSAITEQTITDDFYNKPHCLSTVMHVQSLIEQALSEVIYFSELIDRRRGLFVFFMCLRLKYPAVNVYELKLMFIKQFVIYRLPANRTDSDSEYSESDSEYSESDSEIGHRQVPVVNPPSIIVSVPQLDNRNDNEIVLPLNPSSTDETDSEGGSLSEWESDYGYDAETDDEPNDDWFDD